MVPRSHHSSHNASNQIELDPALPLTRAGDYQKCQSSYPKRLDERVTTVYVYGGNNHESLISRLFSLYRADTQKKPKSELRAVMLCLFFRHNRRKWKRNFTRHQHFHFDVFYPHFSSVDGLRRFFFFRFNWIFFAEG